MSLNVEAATMMRVLSLPADFFKKYSSGDLTQRTQYITMLCSTMTTMILSAGITSIFSLVYIVQIFTYAPSLVAPALTVTIVTVLFSLISALVQMKISKQRMELASKESGMTFALISGVQKIKLSGAEKRAFTRWGRLYGGSMMFLQRK